MYLCDWKQWNLYHATRIGSVETVDLLFRYGAKDASEGNLLHAAIASLSIPMVEYVLALGIDVNELDDAGKTGPSYGTPLHRVVASIFDPQTEKMRSGHGPNAPRNADITFNIDTVTVLLAHGAGINRVGRGAYRDRTVMQLVEEDEANQIPKEIKELIRHAAWVESMRVPKQSMDPEMAGLNELDV